LGQRFFLGLDSVVAQKSWKFHVIFINDHEPIGWQEGAKSRDADPFVELICAGVHRIVAADVGVGVTP